LKLLKHKQQLLFTLPSTPEFADQKAVLSQEVQDLVSGIVLLRIPNELAWTLYIESKDAKTIGMSCYSALRGPD
jgi:superkiller protein 3